MTAPTQSIASLVLTNVVRVLAWTVLVPVVLLGRGAAALARKLRVGR